MAKKTVLCHFYNEEWLLPFWLKHHREIFDHGIMIDYHSTDRSAEIIRELCPTWQIVTSRNHDFNPAPVDQEVSDHERPLDGWRIALNVPEFMIGNYSHLDDRAEQTRFFLGQWMFVDMERRDEVYYLNSDIPLYRQRWRGYGIVNDFTKNQPYGSVPRAPRSIHNYAAHYPAVGRHFPQEQPTHSDLAIFYYGYASLEPGSIGRRMQIQTQCPNAGANTNHKFTLDQLMDRFKKEQQPLSRDLSEEIKPYVVAHERYLQRKSTAFKAETREDIQAAIGSLTAALSKLQ
jgi:hypothetical protein